MTLPAPYRYRKVRKPSTPRVTNRVSTQKEEEELTGFVQDWEASDIEERFAKALNKIDKVFSFREHYFGPARNTPGAVEVDFMVEDGSWFPIQIDGEYAHRTAAQREKDRLNDARLNQYFQKYGINPIQRIPDGKQYVVGDLDEQESVDQIVKELFG